MKITHYLNIALIALTLAPLAHAVTPGFMTDYQYQVTDVGTMEEAQRLMNIETKETRNRSICANRAHMWSYMINRNRHVQLGKVFIHFTAVGEADENKDWAYHVAPYVLVNGEEVVLDSGFDYFKKKPATLSDWSNYFGKSKNCVVLDPVHNPDHLKLEQYNMPNDWDTPLSYTYGNSRQYPLNEGICYIRKVPMYYAFPVDVYGADLFLSGQNQYAEFISTAFDKEAVVNACKQATTISFKLDHNCYEYLGIAKPKPQRN